MVDENYRQRVLELTKKFMLEDTKLSATDARSKAITKANFEAEIENEKPYRNKGVKGSQND